MGFLSWQSQLLLVGAGLAYLIVAHNKKYFPFNDGGPADFISNSLTDDSTDDSNTPATPAAATPSPSPFLNGPGNPLNPNQSVDLGNGFKMPIPPGGTSSGNGYLPGQVGPTMPLVSTVANDPTPTDYGIYTQYLNGLRQEYQKMTDANQAAMNAPMGIGGDITTLPQPPTTGVVPYGYNAGLPPAPFPPGAMPQFPPGMPLPFNQPPLYMLPPPPRGWRRIRHPRGFFMDISPTGMINIPGVNIGPNGIDVGGLVHIGGDGINIGGGSGGLLGGILGGGGNGGGLLGGILGGGSNNNSGGGLLGGLNLGGLLNGMNLGSGTTGTSNIDLSALPQQLAAQQQQLQSQIQNQVKQQLASQGINVSFRARAARGNNRRRATFINYEQQGKPPQIPIDLNALKPTFFNMVSRNQPMGMIGRKLGNV